MKGTFQKITANSLALRIGLVVLICTLLLALPFIIQAVKRPTITYRPVDACTLLTQSIAKDMLGDETINQRTEPTLNTDTGVATSKCSYSDTDMANMAAASLAVQTGTTDKAVSKIKQDFSAQKLANTTEKIEGVGSEAFFIAVNGQLNVRDDHHWYIFSYTSDGHPAKTSEQAVKLAKSILKD